MSVVRTLIGNVKGPQGEQGEQGTRGPAGTIEVGSVQTVSYGSAASVTNSGTDTEAILDFQIPQGAPGATVTDMSNLVLSSITDTTADYPTFAVGETGSTIFGKIRKFLSDLKEKFVSKSMMTESTNVSTAGEYVADAKAINSLSTSLANTDSNVSALNDSLANIGMEYEGTVLTTNVPNNQDVVLASVTVPAGVYALFFSVQLTSTACNANGYALCYLTSYQPQIWTKGESGEYLANYGRFTGMAVRKFSSQSTIQLIAHMTTHTNGTTASNIALRAVRIK